MNELWHQFRAVLPGLWRHRWVGLAVSLALGIAGAAFVLSIPNRYEATARVFVDTQSILKPLMAGLAVEPNVDQQIQMMARTLVSRPNVERVVRMSDLDLKARTPQERERLIDDLARDIQFRPAAGNNLYSVVYRSGSPDSARRVVQALLSIFVESNLGDKRRDADQARRFIDDQISGYEKRLLAAEAALKEFKIRNLAVMPNLANDYVATAGAAQKEVEGSRLELRQLENSREALRRQLADEAPTYTSTETSEGMRSPRVASETELRLEASRKRLDELLLRYTEAHPDVINLQRMIVDLEVQRSAEKKASDALPVSQRANVTVIPNKVYQDIKVKLADTEARIAALRARVADADVRMSQARSAAQTIPKVEAEYTQLTRDYDVNKKNYEALLARRESAAMSGDMDTKSGVGEFRVIDPPRAASKPVFPNRPLFLIAVLLASIAAGIGTAFLIDQMRPTFFDARTLRAETGMQLLGSVSMVENPQTIAEGRRSMMAFSGTGFAYLGLYMALIVWFMLRSPGQ
jgi:polysaccharide chain length determinant protein (PEP-CTERM system associated)